MAEGLQGRRAAHQKLLTVCALSECRLFYVESRADRVPVSLLSVAKSVARRESWTFVCLFAFICQMHNRVPVCIMGGISGDPRPHPEPPICVPGEKQVFRLCLCSGAENQSFH